MLETCYIAVIISILLCHGPQASKARPSDLDTSVFSLDYDYDSEPYLPTNLGLKEAKMVDPWTLDFRHKLASQKNIGKSSIVTKAPSKMVQYLLVCSFLYDEYYARICIFYIFSVKIIIIRSKQRRVSDCNALSTGNKLLHTNEAQ